MKKLNSQEIREKFLSYFETHQHLKISSSSLLPQNDPTLLFINSGMAPLKNYFLGKEEPPQKRLVNFQPCIRTKDIDDVGDRHHLTLFEMMGSWSIGDYYKDEACRLAYGLLVDELGFDPKKLYMTVYQGNEQKGVAPDEESVKAWMKCGVPADHIIRLGEDNFWGPAGETGPCGPCTEVFYDTGAQHGPEYKPGGHFDDKSRYIEIWNAGVFMELNKNADGTFTPLPLKSVDTGSGLERLAMVMNGHESVYETDLMAPLMELVKKLYGITDIRKVRMIVDHMRASTMILSEGVAPSNEGQGYIPRRLIRKCVAALVANKVEKIDFTPMVDKVIELLSPYYPLLKSGREACLYNLKTEVEEFTPLIKNGLVRIQEEITQLKGNVFPATVAFELVTTFGLPIDVLKSSLDEHNMSINEEEYEACWEEHRKKSRVISRKGGVNADQDALERLISTLSETVFTGYENFSDKGEILALIKDQQMVDQVSAGEDFFFVTNQTPFYGESGGQAGDIGELIAGQAHAQVIDTQKIQKIHLHQAKLLKGSLKKESAVELKVDRENRLATRQHHSATHLLHSALHMVVGKHAVQKGSSVRADRLRFDFQHNKPVSREELDQIEALVNKWVRENSTRHIDLLDYEEAIEKGAVALFGEKYDSKVRVISFGESVELCGGTHVDSTGEIGLFMIVSESAVAKGVRRIEAVTGEQALKLYQQKNQILKTVSEFLNVKPEMIVERLNEMSKKLKEKPKAVASGAAFVKKEDITINGHKFLLAQVEGEASAIKEMGDQMIDKAEQKMICLVGQDDRSLKVFTWVHADLQAKVKAGDLLKEILKTVDGKGGGRPNFAQGGAPDPKLLANLFEAREAYTTWLTSKV